jgi:signal transduction histidine kinase
MFLLTYGLSGVIAGLSNGDRYLFKTYFQSYEFQDRVSYFANLISLFELNGMTKEEAKKKITVSAEEIEEHRYRYGDLTEQIMNIESQYEGQIQSAKDNGNKAAEEVYTEERNKKIEDITKNFKDEEYVREKIIKEKESRIDKFYREGYEYMRSEFNRNEKLFVYYLKDIDTGEVFTNLNIDENEDSKEYMNNKEMLYIESYPGSKGYITSNDGFHYFGDGEVIGTMFDMKESRFAGQIALPKSAPDDSEIMTEYRDFQKSQTFFYSHSISGLAALLISFFLVRRRPFYEGLQKSRWGQTYHRIPLDIRLLLCFISFMGALLVSFDISDYYPYRFGYEWVYSLLFLMAGTFFIAALYIQAALLFNRFRNEADLKSECKTALLYKLIKIAAGAFLIQKTGVQLMLLLSIVFAFGAGAIIVIIEPRYVLLYFPLFLLIGLPAVLLLFKRLAYFNQIVTNTDAIMLGNLETDLPVKGKTVLANLSANINALKHGVKTSQQKQVKSERLKTELITNVSHDLRTPLTSIISYTELLKNPNLSEEERDSYVQIVDRKSQRLKILIDDLFEASKMASGNIDLVKQNVDIAQLLQQALAEYNEAISQSSLQFRVTHSDEPVYAVVDGQKMWRVFENLIGNILKYSLENTRVYLSVKKTGDQVLISFKNVTKYELSENTDELFERFKRGDSSRHTEGSGLGLTIAKSIVELHGGRLEIEVDGDLFKVTILLDAN